MTKINDLYHFTTVNSIGSWLAQNGAVSMRLLLTLALLLLWLRFFVSHVKAYIYGGTINQVTINQVWDGLLFRRVRPLIARTITDKSRAD